MKILKNMQTSKRILFIDFVIAAFLAIVVIIGAFFNKDVSQVTTIAVGWDGQLAVAVGFYYWKAKNENRSKYVMKLVNNWAEKYGIENVARLAEVILRD